MRTSPWYPLLAVLVAAAPARTAAAADLEWETASRDGVTIDKPRGWSFTVEDDGTTVWLRRDRYETSLQIGLLRRRADKDDTATDVARGYFQKSGFTKASFVEDYSFGGDDFAILYGYDRWHTRACRVGVRVEIDRGSGVADILIVRGSERDFLAYGGWETVDRIFVSRDRGAATASHHSRWGWAVQKRDGTALLVPDGWSAELSTADGALAVQLYDGKTPKQSDLVVRVLRVPTRGKELSAASFEQGLVRKRFAAARRINASDRHTTVAIYAAGDYRLALRTKVSRDYAVAVIGLAKPSVFWSSGLIDVLDDFERHIGLADGGLEGLWMGGSGRDVMLHYDNAGHFLEASAEENGLLIAFDPDGTYEFRYLYGNMINNVRQQLASEEVGRYRFDGFNLELIPDKRTVTWKHGLQKQQKRVYAAKELATTRATVHLVLDSPGHIEVVGYGFLYAGHFPGFQGAHAGASGYTFDRIDYEKAGSKAGFKTRRPAQKRKD